ncbi:hypothetical protein [Oryzibacter oryziterrae]|uniref:hypothetical protein n=1 Tax=Oryzibacter oryziterrae TaxID=2766474 RepID=UPI001F17EA84|nr:hypothetical protein [Oryzibacter oryziterrae]
MRIIGLAAFAIAALGCHGAFAADCSKAWHAGLAEEEEGTVMEATICDPKNQQIAFFVACGGEGKVAVRYLPPEVKDYPPSDKPEYVGNFIFSSKGMSAPIDLSYEAMDGAMTANPQRKSDVVKLLMTGDKLTITDKNNLLPPVTFSLKGSGPAIQKVMDACYS